APGLGGGRPAAPAPPAGGDRAGLTTSAGGTATGGPVGGMAAAGVPGASGTPRSTPSATARAPRRAAGTPLLVEQMADTRGARQVVTVTTSSGRAGPVLEAFEQVAGRWRRVFGPVPAVIGAEGFRTPGSGAA